jgi:hypothetical protein
MKGMAATLTSRLFWPQTDRLAWPRFRCSLMPRAPRPPRRAAPFTNSPTAGTSATPRAAGSRSPTAVRTRLQHYRLLDAAPGARAREQEQLQDLLIGMQADLGGSRYADAAECWLNGNTDAQIDCIGCHE